MPSRNRARDRAPNAGDKTISSHPNGIDCIPMETIRMGWIDIYGYPVQPIPMDNEPPRSAQDNGLGKTTNESGHLLTTTPVRSQTT